MNLSLNYKKILFIVISAIFLFLITFGSYFILKKVMNSRRQDRFETVLSEVDTLLSEGFSTEAENLLDSISGYPQTSVDHLKLLKQYHRLSVLINDFSGFLSLATNAAEIFPGRQDIRALEIWALLKSGYYKKAWEKCELVEDKAYNSLKAETLLRFREKLSVDTIDDENLNNNPYLSVIYGENPELFIHAGDKTGISEFYLDGVLLYLKEGDYTQAESVIRNHLDYKYPLLGLLTSIDREKYQTSRRFFDYMRENDLLSADIEILMGDILLREERFEEAAEFLYGYIKRFPEHSWIPYYNLYLVYRNEAENIARQEEILKAGLDSMGENRELSLLYAGFLLDRGDDIGAENVLENLVSSETGGFRAESALIKLLSGRRSPSYVTGRYWELINRYSGQTEPVKDFAVYLIAWSQWDDFSLLMDRYERDWGISPWSLEYRGIAGALRGDYTLGAEKLAGSLELNEKAGTLFNLGVVYEKAGNYKQASYYLQRAIQLSEETFSLDPGLEGRFRIRLGIVYFKNMEFEKSARELDMGLDLIPEDLEGILYRKMINQEGLL